MPGEIHDFWRFFDGKLKKMQRFQPSFFGLGLLGSGLLDKKSHILLGFWILKVTFCHRIPCFAASKAGDWLVCWSSRR
jgi:hypothetical protein